MVTDIGGALCHAAIIAREQGIPCVVGAQSAIEVIRNKALIGGNGDTGEVMRAR